MGMIENAKEPVKLRSKKLKDGRESLYLDIYMGDGQRKKEYLKLYLLPSDKRENTRVLKTAKAIQARRLSDFYDGKISPKKEKKKIAEKVTLIKWVEIVGERKREIGQSKSRSTCFLALIERLKGYVGNKRVMIGDVDKDFLLGFIAYLSSSQTRTYKKVKKTLSKASAELYYNTLVTALVEAEKEELIEVSPHHRVSNLDRKPIKPIKAHRLPLTKSDIQSLMTSDCTNEDVKRAFLFSIFCGLRRSDILSLKWGNVVRGDGGKLFIHLTQTKTREELIAPLSQSAISWMPTKRGDDDSLVFPHLPNGTNLSKYVGRWCKRVLGKEGVTFHIARHTFGTLYYSSTHDLYATQKAMGHKNMKTTQIYAEMNLDVLEEGMNKLDAFFS